MKEYIVQVYSNRTEWLNKQGQRHRIDGPAVEYADGTKCWYQNGQRHRIDGPATEYPDGSKYWYQNGQRHRIDGPAVESPFGNEWYIEGKKLTQEEFNERTKNFQNKNSETMQEVRITVSVPIREHLTAAYIAGWVQSGFPEWTVMQVEEERHIYGNAEDGDNPWVNSVAP